MKQARTAKYYIVKHGLDALQVLPNFVWRTGQRTEPIAFRKIKRGDRWIGFAYTTSDARERPLSRVTGFFECVRESRFGEAPRRAHAIMGRGRKAWMIEGRTDGWSPPGPVGVPPLEQILQRRYFRQSTMVSISRAEYFRIKQQVRNLLLRPEKIPLLMREPIYEHEVLAVFSSLHRRIGVEKLLRARPAFPDLMVKLVGRRDPVHIELEVYASSFIQHRHADQLDRSGCFHDRINGQLVKLPVGLVCWVQDVPTEVLLRKTGLKRVFELKRLIQEGAKICW